MEKIYRDATILPIVDSSEGNESSRTITGKAVSFESWSRDLGGFEEIIKAGAITQELVNTSDVIMNVNHDDSKMVARSRNGQGTLSLDLREDGLYFSFDAPETELGNELLYNVKAGNLFECSFAFTIDPNDPTSERWYRGDDNSLKREISKIDGLFDCAIVTHAAYPSSTCSARSEEIPATVAEVDSMLDALETEINNL